MNVIFGVERTFLVVAMGVMFDLTVGFVTLAVDVDVLLALFATDDAPLAAGETTTGSVEGMGFPSLVCSLRTCWEKIRTVDSVGRQKKEIFKIIFLNSSY